MEDPTLWDSIQQTVIDFLSGRAFLVATGVFFFYIFVTGVLRRIKNGIVGVFMLFLGIFSPLHLRRVFFSGLSLFFMTLSFSLYSGASAKLNGDPNSTLKAVLGGSLAVAIWSIAMLLAHLMRDHYIAKTPTYQKKKKKPFQSESDKVVLPSSFQKDG